VVYQARYLGIPYLLLGLLLPAVIGYWYGDVIGGCLWVCFSLSSVSLLCSFPSTTCGRFLVFLFF
jgi:hypothetical protein